MIAPLQWTLSLQSDADASERRERTSLSVSPSGSFVATSPIDGETTL